MTNPLGRFHDVDIHKVTNSFLWMTHVYPYPYPYALYKLENCRKSYQHGEIPIHLAGSLHVCMRPAILSNRLLLQH